jgi:hypothetical protein
MVAEDVLDRNVCGFGRPRRLEDMEKPGTVDVLPYVTASIGTADAIYESSLVRMVARSYMIQ